MRIAHITATFPPYYAGTGTVCYYNALGLARLGHEVTVFTAPYHSRNYVYPPDIAVRHLPARFRIGNAPFLPGLLKIRDFDVIHLHYPFIFGAEMVWVAARARNIPYVLTYHNDLIGSSIRGFLFDAYSAFSAPLIFRGARKLITVSLDHAAFCRLAPLFRARWADVVEVPNGVDTDVFSPGLSGSQIRHEHGIAHNAKVLLFVGALDRAHRSRRLDLLLEALSILQDMTLHLLVVGDGDQASEYQYLAKDLGVDGQTHFLGGKSHQSLSEIYSAADIVILPSQQQESFGLVLIEAMACGKPVIATNLPGVRSVVSDGEDGLLVCPGDVDDLVVKLQSLLHDACRRRQMGVRGRSKAEKEYSWSKIIPQLVQVYESALIAGASHCRE